MKYQRRKYFREYRKAGVPFMVAHRLSKLRSKFPCFWELEQAMLKEGVTVELVTYCECCGPEAYRLKWKTGEVELSYSSLTVL